ncbi:hypothetical protein ACIBTP_04210 [Streptomyces avidinii]|uniref:hypothetical protein n=1 Tax=Streptomyces avidinii TaxID=1895 RepID=UPI0037BA1DC3
MSSRTAQLLPPRTMTEAGELAKAGELLLELLPDPAGLPVVEAAATIRAAALVGGPRALGVLAGARADTRFSVCHELAASWGRFDATVYANEVLRGASLGDDAFFPSPPGSNSRCWDGCRTGASGWRATTGSRPSCCPGRIWSGSSSA